MANPNPKFIAVLGGGITGLVAAHRLTQLGHRVRLFEQGARLGGVIRTDIIDGWLVEAGPNSFQENSAEVSALIREIGLASERIEANPAAKNRYIVRDRRLVPLPLSAGAFFTSALLSPGAKLRVFRELLMRPRQRAADVSLADFARDHFGQEILDYATQPFVSGTYAGDAEQLSTRHAFPQLWAKEQASGSILRAQIAVAKERRARGAIGAAASKMISFRRGLQTLPDALAAKLPAGVVSLGARVDAVIPGQLQQTMQWHDGQTAHTERFDTVICALPATALAHIATGAAGDHPLAALETIPHPPVSVLFLGFRRDQVSHALDGFGALVPAREKCSMLGVIFSSSLFSERAPSGHVALTVMIGGALQPELAKLPAAQLFATVRDDLRELLGVTSEPVFSRHTFWPRAIPQYNLGYERHLDAMAAYERAHPGILIGGQVRDGIALPNCILAGEKLAAHAVA